eukprot:m.353333 g.353333  ORF g.353333 m.353333 type:complete len:413 (+) comp16740_c0_seq1:452-1690(+)
MSTAVSALTDQMRAQLTIPARDSRPTTDDVACTSGATFEQYQLKPKLLMGILQKGFEAPSPIQEHSLPHTLVGKDVIARGKNGTGKTASFLIPILERIDTAQSHIQAVVLVPTRELALQTAQVCKELGRFLNVQVVTSTGGTSVRDDILRLENVVHVLIATPGRLLDLAGRGAADLSACHILVFDEADKLLSPEFTSTTDQILGHLPADRQIMLFSATFPKETRIFIDKYMPQVEMINTMDTLTLKGLTQFYAFVDERHKLQCLNTLFGQLQIKQAIIFCRSAKRVELLAKKIIDLGDSCLYTHSQVPQEYRNKVFAEFRKGRARMLVCTDLITRGIDVAGVNVVINFDFPGDSETYLHRVGRSGRFGHLGLAINLITSGDQEKLFSIEDKLGTTIAPMPRSVDPALYVSAE